MSQLQLGALEPHPLGRSNLCPYLVLPLGAVARLLMQAALMGHTDIRAWGKLLGDALTRAAPGPREKSSPRAAALRSGGEHWESRDWGRALATPTFAALLHLGVSQHLSRPRGASERLCRLLPKCHLKRSFLAFQTLVSDRAARMRAGVSGELGCGRMLQHSCAADRDCWGL